MKIPTTTHEKVIIKPRPPKDKAQEAPGVGSPADTTAVPDVKPTEETEEGPAEGLAGLPAEEEE